MRAAFRIAEMWRPHASKFGQDIWGLGTILYASNNEGGFVVGHDCNDEPAIDTAAHLNPATGNGIVILETGRPLLATERAGEWVFWKRATWTSSRSRSGCRGCFA